jgi:type IV pilus assembly protein PilO
MSGLEQLTKISLPKKIAVLLIVILLVGAVYWFQFYGGLSEELDQLMQHHTQLMRQRDDALRRKSTYDNDLHRRDELKKNHAQQLRALPSDAEMSSFLASLNTQAELVGLELKSVKPRKEEAAQYYARIPVSLILKGNYLQLAKFFYLVGNVDRIINIENISFKVDGFDESGVQLLAEVMATTFRSVEGESAKKSGKKG